ncbi:pyruvate kinase [Streptacidiphilus sp. MAP12-33]|uniref:pyruvate kinase n=1 Tax=Streptacidiphilus sp. MAP12-33 TaxID=3156266 RepID=UPI003517BF15
MTSLIATVGPSLTAPGVLDQALAAGVGGLRLSASKFDAAQLAGQLRTIRQALQRTGRHADVLLDLPGAKTRLANDDWLDLDGITQLRIDFTPAPVHRDGQQARVGVTGPGLGPVQPGDVLVFGDGEDAARVVQVTAGHLVAQPLTRGAVGRRKGVAVLGRPALARSLAGGERELVTELAPLGLTGVIVSFVEDADVLNQVRAWLPAQLALVAKVETRAGIVNSDAILPAADALLLGRGDLLLDAGETDFYDLGKTLLKKAQQAGCPVVVGTQLLSSLSQGWLPNRSELAYLSHLLEKGVDGLMLAAETTVGERPVRAVQLAAELAARYGTTPLGPLFPVLAAAGR